MPGIDGKNGKDGRDGAIGPIGLQGPIGVQGLRGTGVDTNIVTIKVMFMYGISKKSVARLKLIKVLPLYSLHAVFKIQSFQKSL